MKFKVGDWVKVVKVIVNVDITDTHLKALEEKYIGQEGEVISLEGEDGFPFRVEFRNLDEVYNYSENIDCFREEELMGVDRQLTIE